MNLGEVARSVGGLLSRPGLTLDRVAARPSPAAAALLVAMTGGLWSLLCVLLWRAGHSPSQVLVPIAPPSYYLAQALWVVPLLLFAWWVVGTLSHLLSRWAGGKGSRASMLACAGYAYAVPLAVVFVIPDLVAYLGFGFGSLARLVRVTGLLLVVAEWALLARAIVAAHQLAWSRAVPIALVALLVQAALVGPVLR